MSSISLTCISDFISAAEKACFEDIKFGIVLLYSISAPFKPLFSSACINSAKNFVLPLKGLWTCRKGIADICLWWCFRFLHSCRRFFVRTFQLALIMYSITTVLWVYLYVREVCIMRRMRCSEEICLMFRTACKVLF